jgi:hypothetical protein
MNSNYNYRDAGQAAWGRHLACLPGLAESSYPLFSDIPEAGKMPAPHYRLFNIPKLPGFIAADGIEIVGRELEMEAAGKS